MTSIADTMIHKFHILLAEFHYTIHKTYAMDTLCHNVEFQLVADFPNCLADKILAHNNPVQIYTFLDKKMMHFVVRDPGNKK